MTIFKRELLFKMIDNGAISSFTILGAPKEDLQQAFIQRKDLIEFLNSKNIDCNITDKFDGTAIEVYFPEVERKRYIDVCSITVKRAVTEQEYNSIIDLFDNHLGYYQANLSPKLINKILGLYENDEDNIISIREMIDLTGENQNTIAMKLNKSRQLINDICNGRANLTLPNLRVLMKEYPLLPWGQYIISNYSVEEDNTTNSI